MATERAREKAADVTGRLQPERARGGPGVGTKCGDQAHISHFSTSCAPSLRVATPAGKYLPHIWAAAGGGGRVTVTFPVSKHIPVTEMPYRAGHATGTRGQQNS